MTRDEHRAKCIETMEIAGNRRISEGEADLRAILTSAFESLHGIARVVPIEATKEMLHAALPMSVRTNPELWRAMSAAGDLTNAPENRS
jgi:hypothetical protein